MIAEIEDNDLLTIEISYLMLDDCCDRGGFSPLFYVSWFLEE